MRNMISQMPCALLEAVPASPTGMEVSDAREGLDMHSAAVAVEIPTQDDETAASAILALAPPASSPTTTPVAAALASAAAATAPTTKPVAAAAAAPLFSPPAPLASDSASLVSTNPPASTGRASALHPRTVAAKFAKVSECIRDEELTPEHLETADLLINKFQQSITPSIQAGLDRKSKNRVSFMSDHVCKRPCVGNQYNTDNRELPIACAASIMEQGFCIVPNPRGHIANVRNAFERAALLNQLCARFSAIGQMYPDHKFGSKPNIGDGKRQSTDRIAACTWANALLIMLHFIIAYYELGTQVLELEGDELPQFLECSMLRSLMGVKVQGGHFDTEIACKTFMQHGPRGRPDSIVAISPIDGPSNVLILKNWDGSKVPTAEEFADHATPIDIPADHTLLMSDHMPHAGGDIAGRRAHAIFTRPDLEDRKPSEKKTYWLKPECVPEGK